MVKKTVCSTENQCSKTKATKRMSKIKDILRKIKDMYMYLLYIYIFYTSLLDDAVKVLHSICQQIWKTQQWPQDWKRSVFIPMPKNAQTTAQLHSSHTLVK